MWPNPQETADLVTFTDEILNEKLHFLCSVIAYVPFCFTCLCAYVTLLNYVPTSTCFCVLRVYLRTCLFVLRMLIPMCLIIHVPRLKKSLIQQLSHVTLLQIPAQFFTAPFIISLKIAKFFKKNATRTRFSRMDQVKFVEDSL